MRGSLNILSSSMPLEWVLYPGPCKVYWQHYSIVLLNLSIKEPMCHSSKHTADICIQDNETCHVNFILCLLALFVLSLFLAVLPFVSPPFGSLDESSSRGQGGSPFQCMTDTLFINLLCIIQFLLFYSVQIYSRFHLILHPRTPPTNHLLLNAACSNLQQVIVSTPAFFSFSGSLCPLCLHSAFSFCKVYKN